MPSFIMDQSMIVRAITIIFVILVGATLILTSLFINIFEPFTVTTVDFTEAIIKQEKDVSGIINDLDWNIQSQQIGVSSTYQTHIFDLSTNSFTYSQANHISSPTHFSWHPLLNLFASGSLFGQIKLKDLQIGTEILIDDFTTQSLHNRVRDMVWSKEGDYLIWLAHDQSDGVLLNATWLSIYDIKHQSISRIPQNDEFEKIAVHPSLPLVISIKREGDWQLNNYLTGETLLDVDVHLSGNSNAFATFSPGGTEIATLTSLGGLTIFEINASDKSIELLSSETYRDLPIPTSLVWHPRSSILAFGSPDAGVTFWSVVGKGILSKFEQPVTNTTLLTGVQGAYNLKFSPNGLEMVISLGGTFRIWEFIQKTTPSDRFQSSSYLGFVLGIVIMIVGLKFFISKKRAIQKQNSTNAAQLYPENT